MPPRCLMCRTRVSHAGLVCVECFKQLEFIESPYCQSCARPFVSAEEAGNSFICLECEDSSILWHDCRAPFIYNEGLKKLIMPLKYGDQQKALGFLSQFMYRSAQDLIHQADFIIPVPLHKNRLRFRKYNQSALLAWQLGRMGKVDVLPMGLLRLKETLVLGHFNKVERQSLLKDAFVVSARWGGRLANKRVLLIDDVMTTGSTLRECTLTLLNAEVAYVDVLVTAKVM